MISTVATVPFDTHFTCVKTSGHNASTEKFIAAAHGTVAMNTTVRLLLEPLCETTLVEDMSSANGSANG